MEPKRVALATIYHQETGGKDVSYHNWLETKLLDVLKLDLKPIAAKPAPKTKPKADELDGPGL